MTEHAKSRIQAEAAFLKTQTQSLSRKAVEHYEMTRYGTLKSWAKQLGHTDAAALLDATLAEETKTGKLLTQLGGPANSAAVAHAKPA